MPNWTFNEHPQCHAYIKDRFVNKVLLHSVCKKNIIFLAAILWKRSIANLQPALLIGALLMNNFLQLAYTQSCIRFCFSFRQAHQVYIWTQSTVTCIWVHCIPSGHVLQPLHFPSHRCECVNVGFHNMTMNMASWRPTHVDPKQVHNSTPFQFTITWKMKKLYSAHWWNITKKWT